MSGRGGTPVSCALLALLFLATGALPSFAALPTYYQRVREIQAILDDGRVQEKLGGATIDAITFIEQDLYEVVGGNCVLEVRIVDVPPPPGQKPILGPRQFALDVGEADCEAGAE